MGIRDRPTAARSPWQNGYAERLIGSIRRECLDYVVVFGERHFGDSAKATEGMAISLKDQLVTGADARLRIMLTEDTEITLGENAKASDIAARRQADRGEDGARQSHGQRHGVLGRDDGRGHRRRGRVRGQRRGEQRGGARLCSTPGPSRSSASTPKPWACVQDHPQTPSARRCAPAAKARVRRSCGRRRRRIAPWLRSPSEAR